MTNEKKNDKVQVIEKLTPEQEAMLPGIAEECIAYGLSTVPLDKKKCLEAAKLCYKLAGVEPPPDNMFMFLPSPNAGMEQANKWEGDGNQKPKFIPPFYGCHEMGFLSFYIAFQRFGLECVNQMQGLIDLARNAGWTWFFDEGCIITERPAELHLDDQGRLHSTNSMAVRFSDGWGIYAVHGIVVTEKIIMHPSTLTAKEIDAEPNAEIRRVMIEQHGEEQYLMGGGAIEVSKDDYGTLMKKPVPNDEDLYMVRVVNSTAEPDGHFKTYFLRCPPTMTTAREAIAWSFGMKEQEYAPVLET